jgi:2-oxoglutarate ferredoxin oxidoreductase subunit gamma
MAFHYELRFAGIGGQGNMLAGAIIAEAAIFFEGKYATQVPTYTSQVRGGPTKADIIISDEPIYFAESTHINFFLALDQRTYGLYKGDTLDGAIVLVDNGLVDVPEEDRKRWDVYEFPIVRTAKYEVGNVITANILSVGMTAELTHVMSLDNIFKAVEKRVPPAFLELNEKAFYMGVDIAKKLKAEKGKA